MSLFDRSRVLSLAILAAMSVGSAAGAAQVNGIQMFVVKGQCLFLSLGDDNYTDGCSGDLLSTAYPDHRVGFHFNFGDGKGLSFSGMDGDNPTPNSDITLVDKVIINLKGGLDGATGSPAKGKCTYDNPFRGIPAKVTCSGRLLDGRKFSGMFVSDGQPPK